MGARVALCIDGATCLEPGLIGLEGEALDAQRWLCVYPSGEEARRAIKADDVLEEAWVVSSDDIEPINLAATLKADRPDITVRLVVKEGCGSLYSRAHTALIDEVVDGPALLRRYADAKRMFAEPLAKGDSAKPLPLALPVQAGRAFLLPIVSGSGGAGKSSVAVMSALIAQSMGYQTLLLDYDLQFGDVAGMVGLAQPLRIDEAIAHPDKLQRELRRDPGLAVLAAPSRLESAEEVIRAMPQFLAELQPLFDVIIANTGAAWAEQHAVLLERCSQALFLVDQRASSVRACQHALELCARCGIASGPFQFAINRCTKNAPFTSIDVSCALQGAPVFELKDGGRDVEDYLGGGVAAELLETRNDFCTSLEHVMAKLLPSLTGRDGDLAAQANAAKALSAAEGRASKRRGAHMSRKRRWGSQ